MEPKDFQEITAQRILQLFKKGRKRVLLADEVGLGKTIVARRVIDLVKNWHANRGDRQFDVVYICSNANIAQQNIEKLIPENEKALSFYNVSENRLSMQSIMIYDKTEEVDSYFRIMPLTPGTSFKLTAGTGIQQERALIYSVLWGLAPLARYREELKMMLKQQAGKNWDFFVNFYLDKRKDSHYDNYFDRMQRSVSEKLAIKENSDIIDRLIYFCTEGVEKWATSPCFELINRLRKIFAEIGLEDLNPDLVIMDEFQRFRDLLDADTDSEQSMLAHKFFNMNKDDMHILLLSATPYKPYTTLEELNETNVDEGYQDFFSLMNFLNKGSHVNTDFETVWKDYSLRLSQADVNDLTVLQASKQKAEDEMYQVMNRTERINFSNTNVRGVASSDISEGDIMSYCQMQRLLEYCQSRDAELGLHYRSYNVPMAYVKSCPYLLSFMNNYQLKKHIMGRTFANHVDEIFDILPPKQQQLFLKYDWVWRYRKLPDNNARLTAVKKILFNNRHSERLLWVPASNPYYKTPGSIFENNRDFSKLLIFSAWEMVPRMLSVMLSYEAERLTIGLNKEEHYRKGKKRQPEINQEAENLFCYPSKYLAGLYHPSDYFGQNIKDIRKAIRQKIHKDIQDIGVGYANNRGAEAILNLLKYIEGKENVQLTPVPVSAEDLLTDMAIASPAVCMYRILSAHPFDNMEKDCINFGKRFESLFNRRECSAVINLEDRRHESFIAKAFDYCVKGNLQSVLDEYAQMFSKQGESLFRAMDDGFIEGTPTFDIDMYTGARKIEKRAMRVHYAVSFANTKVTDKDINRSATVRTTFNSPFRPFVLISTSVGQEGLDFHWYARKIVHWNLPFNPVDLEQREGRINRFKCLAIRRNIAHLYGNVWRTWDEMFDEAAKEFKGSHSDLVPYWCLPPDMEKRMNKDGQYYEKIERIFPMYPLSTDNGRYDRMEKILALYRYTMGHPRQEELVELLNDRFTEEELRDLEINLCPFEKESKLR